MPFTLAHPAAVLPLLRTPLVPSALVAGAVAPDVPYYVSLRWLGGDYNLTLTHAASSLLWLDPLLALVLLACFHGLLKWPLTALLPRSAAERAWPAATGFAWRSAPAVAWTLLSVVVGAATHLAWDGLGTFVGSSWSGRVDLAGTALGGAALAGWGVRWWRTAPRRPIPPGTLLPRWPARCVLVGLVATAALAGAVAVARELPEVQRSLRELGEWSAAAGLEHGARIFVVHAATALGVATGLYALGWQLARRLPHRRRSQPTEPAGGPPRVSR